MYLFSADMPDGLYTVKDNNLVQLTMRNTDVRPLTLLKNKPITGITIHFLNEEYYQEIPISRDTLRTYRRRYWRKHQILYTPAMNPHHKISLPNNTWRISNKTSDTPHHYWKHRDWTPRALEKNPHRIPPPK